MWSRPYNVICTPETFGMWVHTLYVGPIKWSFPLLSRKDVLEEVTNSCCFKIVLMSIGKIGRETPRDIIGQWHERKERYRSEGLEVQHDRRESKTPPTPSQHAHISYIHRVGNENAFPTSISFRPTSSSTLACSTPLPKTALWSHYHPHSRLSFRYPRAISSPWSGCSWL